MAVPLSYQERKAQAIDAGECLRGDCRNEPADDSLYCPTHRDDRRRARAESMARLRRKRRRARTCIDCGQERPRGQSLCEGCKLARGRIPKRVASGADEQAARERRLAAATRKHEDGRTRYHGQQKRGSQPQLQLDGQDLGYARDMLDRGETGLRYYETPDIQAMPRIQREDVKADALHRLGQAVGHIEDVMRRRDRKFFAHFQERHGARTDPEDVE